MKKLILWSLIADRRRDRAGVRAARTAASPATGDKAPGEDDTLYSCKKKTGMVAVTFKPETELKDLIAWVMGFTCKNFILDPRIVSTGKKVTVIAPLKMSRARPTRVPRRAVDDGPHRGAEGQRAADRRVGDREERDRADLSRRASRPTTIRWCATCCARRTRRSRRFAPRSTRSARRPATSRSPATC